MFPRRDAILAIVVSLIGAASPAQTPPPTPEDEQLETYLSELGLWNVLGAHLRERMTGGAADDRLRAAEALGSLYVRLLTDARTPEERQTLERLSRDLLDRYPDAESLDLRISLAKAEYLPVEEIVERHRLRMATEADRAEALRVLRHVLPVLEDIAAKAGRRVDQLLKKETLAHDEAIEQIRADLGEARRLQSLARYYAAWVEYYTALLTNTPSLANRALEDFGYILNAVPGKPASLERLPSNLLRFEHVSRAAIGCALCASMLGRDTEAIRWLDAVEGAEEVPEAILGQVFARRVIVYAAARRWADIETEVRQRRQGVKTGPPSLSVAEARLVAVLALEAARDSQTIPAMKAAAERQSRIAMGDLIRAGEIAHILDLVERFGTEPIGVEGFVVTYVRGLRAYDLARAAHRASGSAPDDPALEPANINQYREARGLLAAALASSDAGAFPGERPRAMIREGLAAFYAGDVADAAETFEAAAKLAGAGDARRDALWYAIVALDHAVDASLASAIPKRDALATLFIKEFPGSDQAATLLLRQTRADGLSDAEAVRVLLGVPPESPLHNAARRQAARLLYREFRRASSAERDFAALRFADVVEPLLRADHAVAVGSVEADGKAAAQSLVTLVRQLADALLGMTSPDVQRVEGALGMLDAAEAYHALDLRPIRGELHFRRMQIALAKGDEPGAQRLLDAIRGTDERFSAAADRLLYQRALKAWRDNASDPRLARDVVRHGERLLDQAEASGAVEGQTLAGIRDAVAGAAIVVYREERSDAMRDLAIRTDQAQLASGVRTAASLRRLAELLEAAGDADGSLAAWNELLAGLDAGQAAWFEARYESLRLLSRTNPTHALEVMRQHKVLRPDFGPEPWGQRLRELDAALSAPAAPAKGGAG